MKVQFHTAIMQHYVHDYLAITLVDFFVVNVMYQVAREVRRDVLETLKSDTCTRVGHCSNKFSE